MCNSREFCNQDNDEHALVSPTAEVRDSLGVLAIHVLASKKNLAEMDYCDMLKELYEIVVDLHKAFDQERPRSMTM